MAYKYTGPEDSGIPGLPHEISDELASKWEAEYKEVEKLSRSDPKKLSARELKKVQYLHLLPWPTFQAALAAKKYAKVAAKEPAKIPGDPGKDN